MNDNELDRRLEHLTAGVETHLPPVGDVRQRGERLSTRRRHIRRATASVAVTVPVLLLAAFLLRPQNGDSVQITSDGNDETIESPSTPDVDADQLLGRTFVGDRVTEDGNVRLLAGEMPLRLSFEADGQIQTSGGCNTTEARLDLEALAQGHLKLEPWGERFSTLAGCLTTPDLMDQDTWLIDLLDSGIAWRLDGDDLVLTTEHLEIRLTDRAVVEPDLGLIGTVWTVDILVDEHGEESRVSADVEATVLLSTDGNVAVYTGCNSGTATWDLSDDRLHIGDLGITHQACPDDTAAELEDALMAALSTPQPFTVSIDAQRLALTDPDGRAVLYLRGAS